MGVWLSTNTPAFLNTHTHTYIAALHQEGVRWLAICSYVCKYNAALQDVTLTRKLKGNAFCGLYLFCQVPPYLVLNTFYTSFLLLLLLLLLSSCCRDCWCLRSLCSSCCSYCGCCCRRCCFCCYFLIFVVCPEVVLVKVQRLWQLTPYLTLSL